jgi:predicted RNA binding protein YcfA (HicA-like mRNA interferase family)
LHKRTADETLKLIVPAYRPIKRSTLSHIIKQAGLSLDDFLDLLR